jgi:integrase
MLEIFVFANFRAQHHPDLPLFDIADKHTAEMIQKDLKRAGIPYIDERGHYADFHALRKTFITNLSRAGLSPKTAQFLARHSDINLTLNTYTMLGVCDRASAVESLPPVPQMAAAATPSDENTMSTLADRPRPECHDTAA